MKHPAAAGPHVPQRGALVVGFVAAMLVSGLAGRSNGSISSRFTTPITPAGYAFSVWGLIYLLQAAAVLWAALPFGYKRADPALEPAVRAVAVPWLLGWLFESLWVLIFRAQTYAGMWVCLAAILAAFASFAWAWTRTRGLATPRTWHGAFVSAAFKTATSLNAGWLSAASSVAAMVVPVAKGGVSVGALRGVGIALVALVTLLSVAVSLTPDVAWPAVVAWAAIAIAVAGKGGKSVGIAAIVCAAVAVAAAVVAAARILRAQRAAPPAAGAPASAVTTA